MQDCFRQHPEMYGEELAEDEDDVEAELHAREEAQASSGGVGEAAPKSPSTTASVSKSSKTVEEPYRERREASHELQKAGHEKTDDLLPKAAHDAAE